MLESKFQSMVIHELRIQFPGCLVLKNDSGYLQGIPDLLILYKSTWAALECKASIDASHQPNQEYYVGELDKMSYAAFIYPENMEDIFYELQQALSPRRKSRVSKRE